MLDLTAFLIIIISLALIIILVSRKLPHVQKVNVEDINHDKKKKYHLLEQRLKRNMRDLKNKLKLVHGIKHLGQIGQNLKKTTLKIKQKKDDYLDDLRSFRNRKPVNPLNPENRILTDDSVLAASDDKLTQIKALIKEDKTDEAEKKIYDLIKQDPKCLEAYKLLAEFYLDAKNFMHAEATLEHIINLADRLAKISATDHLQLAKVKLKLDKAEEALQNAKKAVILEPLNPKILHFIIELSIFCKQKDWARKYYAKLKEIDPENNGLTELENQLNEL